MADDFSHTTVGEGSQNQAPVSQMPPPTQPMPPAPPVMPAQPVTPIQTVNEHGYVPLHIDTIVGRSEWMPEGARNTVSADALEAMRRQEMATGSNVGGPNVPTIINAFGQTVEAAPVGTALWAQQQSAFHDYLARNPTAIPAEYYADVQRQAQAAQRAGYEGPLTQSTKSGKTTPVNLYADIGDSKTADLISKGTNPYTALVSQAASSKTIRAREFYLNEAQKYLQNVQVLNPGAPIATEARNIQIGLQDEAWQRAIDRYNGKENSPILGNLSQFSVMAVNPGAGQPAPSPMEALYGKSQVIGLPASPIAGLTFGAPVALEGSGLANAQRVSETQTIPTGALPGLGVVPLVSPTLAFFMPGEKKTETSRITTTAIEGGTQTTKEGVKSTEVLPTPFTSLYQSVFPSPETVEKMPLSMGDVIQAANWLNPLAAPHLATAEVGQLALTQTQKALGGNTDVMDKAFGLTQGSLSPGSKEFAQETYRSYYEDPGRAALSTVIGAALAGSSGALKGLGSAEKIVAASPTTQNLIAGGLKLGSYGIGALYASDITKKATGVSPGEAFGAFHPTQGPNGEIIPAQGFEGLVSRYAQQYPGPETTARELNKAIGLDIVPFAGAYGTISGLTGRLAVRGPEIKTADAFSYRSGEGFPTSQDITTQDLINSYKAGTLTLEKPLKLGEVKMASAAIPGQEVSRIPVGTQIGVPEGSTRIFSGAENPYLSTGFVGEGHSELPGTFTSPVGLRYFTKAGTNSGATVGFGGDVLGLTQQPTLYRITVPEGKYQPIPENLLNIPTEGFGANDPFNPRNLAIAEWLRVEAKPGVPAIGQYGKSEFQAIVPPGTEVVSTKNAGFIREGNNFIQVKDVVLGETRSTQYNPPIEKTNPMTGEKIYPSAKYTAASFTSLEPTPTETAPLLVAGLFSTPQEKTISKTETTAPTTSEIFTIPSITPSIPEPLLTITKPTTQGPPVKKTNEYIDVFSQTETTPPTSEITSEFTGLSGLTSGGTSEKSTPKISLPSSLGLPFSPITGMPRQSTIPTPTIDLFSIPITPSTPTTSKTKTPSRPPSTPTKTKTPSSPPTPPSSPPTTTPTYTPSKLPPLSPTPVLFPPDLMNMGGNRGRHQTRTRKTHELLGWVVPLKPWTKTPIKLSKGRVREDREMRQLIRGGRGRVV